jgi:hypothetical protein
MNLFRHVPANVPPLDTRTLRPARANAAFTSPL